MYAIDQGLGHMFSLGPDMKRSGNPSLIGCGYSYKDKSQSIA